jgi:hypothetical protein
VYAADAEVAHDDIARARIVAGPAGQAACRTHQRDSTGCSLPGDGDEAVVVGEREIAVQFDRAAHVENDDPRPAFS